jgi:hypothetical protein
MSESDTQLLKGDDGNGTIGQLQAAIRRTISRPLSIEGIGE